MNAFNEGSQARVGVSSEKLNAFSLLGTPGTWAPRGTAAKAVRNPQIGAVPSPCEIRVVAARPPRT